MTWLISVFVAELWTGYGLVFHVSAELYSNTSYVAVACVVIVFAARHQGVLRRTTMIFIVATALAVMISLVGTMHQWRWILATLADVSAIVIYIPQMLLTLRSRDLQGVSLISWVLALMTSLAWGVFGLLIHQPAVALPSVVMFPSALVILIQVSRHRLRARGLDGSMAPLIE